MVTNILLFEQLAKLYRRSTVSVASYGSGRREDVLNRCLKFVEVGGSGRVGMMWIGSCGWRHATGPRERVCEERVL